MKRLILMRHAKSDWSLGEDDHDRPLNKRGFTSAHALGEWLKSKGYLPDEILCSSANRTRQTLEALEVSADTTFDQKLYLADPGVLLDQLCNAQGDVVLMLAHNPGIAMLAQGLVSQPLPHPRFQDYPTGATLVVDFKSDTWAEIQPGLGQVVDFVIPRELVE